MCIRDRFGREEIEEIIPAVEEARAEGINTEGPIPADTIFSKARGGWYDVVVAMYHDQGHIPLKVVGFVYNQEEQKWDAVEGVNLSLIHIYISPVCDFLQLSIEKQ